ncbi:methyltransferase domain-containing protein [Coprothermobacteraceae bacterium]|nr:methyltransferase domain-containing protein [Coprothermobacteraceae bacterium]
MRITGGKLKNLSLNPPKVPGLRPLPERERLSLFNMLGSVEGVRVADLFAGSGIVAFEFLSRGASTVVAVEMNRRLCSFMREQAASWDVELRVVCGDVMRFLSTPPEVDIIFMGPPNNQGYVTKVLDRLLSLEYTGLVIVQRSHKEDLPIYAKVLRSTGKDESIIEIVKLELSLRGGSHED